MTKELHLYPNPTKGIVQISGIYGDIHFEIFNLKGDKVLEGETNNNQLNLSNLPEAAYFINLHFQNQTFTKNLIIKN